VVAVELDAVTIAFQQAQNVGANGLDVHVGDRVMERPGRRDRAPRRLRSGLAEDADRLELCAERERIHAADPPAKQKRATLRSRGLPARVR